MKVPSFQLSWWLILFGWILVIGGLFELVDLFYYALPGSRWLERTFFIGFIQGPATHIGLGLLLWALARR